MKMWKTPSREKINETQGTSEGECSGAQRSSLRRFSDFTLMSTPPPLPPRRRASEMPRIPSTSASGSAGSNKGLISILSSLTSSATEINRCDDEVVKPDVPSGRTPESKNKSFVKRFRSNSFDISILNGDGVRQFLFGTSKSTSSPMRASNWFVKRHQPISKKKKSDELHSSKLNFHFDKSRLFQSVKDRFGKTSRDSEIRSKVSGDDSSGTKTGAQVISSNEITFSIS